MNEIHYKTINDEIRFKALVKHIEDWESIAFDLYTSKRDKYGECDQEVAILKGEWKVWNVLLALVKDDRRMAQIACDISEGVELNALSFDLL